MLWWYVAPRTAHSEACGRGTGRAASPREGVSWGGTAVPRGSREPSGCAGGRVPRGAGTRWLLRLRVGSPEQGKGDLSGMAPARCQELARPLGSRSDGRNMLPSLMGSCAARGWE